MAKLEIVVAPDPRLNICSAEVKKVDKELQKLMDDMLETMYTEEGIGLAAVQVGVHKRVIVIDLQDGESKPLYIINPEILELSKDHRPFKEGCLSYPNQERIEIIRPDAIKIKYLDYNGKEQILETDGLLATCIQHEIDHLNGVTIPDHIESRLKKSLFMKKVTKTKKILDGEKK